MLSTPDYVDYYTRDDNVLPAETDQPEKSDQIAIGQSRSDRLANYIGIDEIEVIPGYSWDLGHHNSLENVLINHGYTPLHRIIIDRDGSLHGKYLKCLNRRGQSVYVLLDVPGHLLIKESDHRFIIVQDSTVLPLSLKMGTYHKVNQEITGVAFECRADVLYVVMRPHNSLTPVELVLVHQEIEIDSSESILEGSCIIPFPIIRMSEILADPEEILANSDRVLRRLRNMAYAHERRHLIETKDSVTHLTRTFETFYDLSSEVAKKIAGTLAKLEEYEAIYQTNPPINEKEREKYRNLILNIAQRNEKMVLLLKLIRKVNSLKGEFDTLTQDLEEVVEFSIAEFENLENRLDT